MGFRNPNTGEEATFQVVDPRTGKPYTRLIGPAEGHRRNRTLTGRGYLVVDIPAGVTGAALDVDSVTDLAPEFKLAAGSPVSWTIRRRPCWWMASSGIGSTAQRASGNVSIIWMKETLVLHRGGWPGGLLRRRRLPGRGQRLAAESASTVATIPVFMIPLHRCQPGCPRPVARSATRPCRASHQRASPLLRKEQAGDVEISRLTPLANQKAWVALGAGKVRLFFDPNDSDGIKAGVYSLTVATTAAWKDSACRR